MCYDSEALIRKKLLTCVSSSWSYSYCCSHCPLFAMVLFFFILFYLFIFLERIPSRLCTEQSSIPRPWDHDLSQKQQSEAQLTEPPRCPFSLFKRILCMLSVPTKPDWGLIPGSLDAESCRLSVVQFTPRTFPQALGHPGLLDGACPHPPGHIPVASSSIALSH